MTTQKECAAILKEYGPLTPAEFVRAWTIKHGSYKKNTLATGLYIEKGEARECKLTGDYRRVWQLTYRGRQL